MQRSRARLLRHRGHGPVHFDLVFEGGARCPTMHLVAARGRWQARWGVPHRRRYLSYSGPVADGRGIVTGVWRGLARRWRLSDGWCARLGSMTTILMRGTHARIIGQLPRGGLRG